MEGPAAVGVDDPVEDDGEEEEGDGVEDFVVDVGSDLEGGQASVACEEEQQEEDSCRVVSVYLKVAGPELAWEALERQVEVEWGGELQSSAPAAYEPANGSRILISGKVICRCES